MRSHYGHTLSKAHYDVTDRYLLDIWCDTCQCDATEWELFRQNMFQYKLDWREIKYNITQGYG